MGEQEKDRHPLLPLEPPGTGQKESKAQRSGETEPQKVPRADLGRTHCRARGRESGCTRPRRGQRATSPSRGDGTRRAEEKEAWPGENEETEPGKGVIREAVKENPRGEGKSGLGYLLGVCPPAVPPESG